MKATYKYLVLPIVAGVFALSCEKLEVTNDDPNNPAEVPSHMLMSGAQKRNASPTASIGRSVTIRRRIGIRFANR